MNIKLCMVMAPLLKARFSSDLLSNHSFSLFKTNKTLPLKAHTLAARAEEGVRLCTGARVTSSVTA
jgi:hypothetical protein